LRKYKFNNHEFWGPSNAVSILSHFYGEYMNLPEEKDRIPHYNKVFLK